MGGGAWWAAVHGVAKSLTRQSDFTFTFHFHALEKEMATRSSILAWRIPWTEKPGGPWSTGLQRESDATEVTKHTLYSREGDGTPLQYSCLENPMDGGAW